MKILLIEDNVELAGNIAKVLVHGGNEVATMSTLRDAKEYLKARLSSGECIDQIILDLSLPDGEGKSLIELIRGDAEYNQANSGYTPILVLTAKINIESKVECLDAGADDYLTKPFAMEELLARIRCLQRINGGIRVSLDGSDPKSVISIGNININLGSKTVREGGKELINLSPLQFRLLEFLLTHRGEVKNAEEIYCSVWGSEDSELLFSDTLKVHISGIRSKLGQDIIRTVKGYGYIID